MAVDISDKSGNSVGKVKKKKEIRRNLILKTLLDNGSLSMTEIKDITGMSLPVVSSLVQSLKEKKLVEEIKTTSQTSAGRPPTTIKLNGNAGYFLGVDMDRIYSRFILLDLEMKTVDFLDTKMSFLSADKKNLNNLKKEIEKLLKKNKIPWGKLYGIGISIPGIVDSRSKTSSTYLNFGDEATVDVLQNYLNVPVHIEHDVKAMTLGEIGFGKAKNTANALCVKIGWGIGLGMIVEGKVYYGENSLAGEFGHIPVIDRKGELCYCGKKGCLETVASGKSLASIALNRLNDGAVSKLTSIEGKELSTLDFRDILSAANEGDQFSLEILEESAKSIGVATATLVNIFNPGKIIFGGEIASSTPDIYLDTIRINAKKYSLNQLNSQTEFIKSDLGNKAGALGVALLAARDLFEIDHLTPWAYV